MGFKKKKVVSLAISALLVAGLFSGNWGMKRVEAADEAKVINISDYIEYDHIDIEEEEDIIVNLDAEASFKWLWIGTPGTITFKGDKKLTIDEPSWGFDTAAENTVFESGVNIDITSSGLYVQGDLDIKSGANLSVTGDEDSDFYDELEEYFLVEGDITSAGNITLKSDEYGISAYYGYDDRYNITINGGKVTVNCIYDAIYGNDISINGGNVILNCDNYSIEATNINVSGGYLESNCNSLELKDNIYAAESINISDDMYIAEPEGGKVIQVAEEEEDVEPELVTSSGGSIIADANDEVPNKIVIAPIPEPEPEPTPEPTPTPDPTTNYKNEWVDGKWYDANGKCTYDGILSWKQNETGWWVEDTKGWYPTSTWQKIDGKWYYFCADGYMDYSEYRDGYWLGDDGAWVEDYYGGHWMSDSTGWWYEDASGWYPVSRWLWIDGSCYYFEASGYMATSKYVDGYWVGADGAWVK